MVFMEKVGKFLGENKFANYLGNIAFKLMNYDYLSQQNTKNVEAFLKLHRDFLRLSKERNFLAEEDRSLEDQVEELQKKVTENRGKVQQYDDLKSKHDILRREILKIRKFVQYVKDTYVQAPANRKFIHSFVKDKGGYVKALEDFKNCERDPLTLKIKQLETKVSGLRGFSVSNVISATLNINQRAKEIPFVYYDFVNQHLYHTPKTLEIFDFAPEEKLTLKQLLNKIEKKYREKIFKSLKSGKGLRHYKVMTSEEDPKQLILTTHPYFYEKEAVGVGIFLRDSRYSWHRIRMHGFDKEIEEIVKNMSKAFSIVGKSIERKVEKEEKLVKK